MNAIIMKAQLEKIKLNNETGVILCLKINFFWDFFVCFDSYLIKTTHEYRH